MLCYVPTVALLRKQADLIERGFYILEEPEATPLRYLVGPLMGSEPLAASSESNIYGQFKSFDLKESQAFASPLFSFDESGLKNFLVTASHSSELLTLAPQDTDKKSYEEIFLNLKTQFEKGPLLKAVPYICLEQDLEEFISLEAFSFMALTGLRNKKSGYFFGFFNPLSKRALLGCSPEYIYRTTESGEVFTTAVAGTKKTSSKAAWTEKLKSEQRMVMDGVSEILEGQVTWNEVKDFSYGGISHLKSEGLIGPGVKIKGLSQKLHPTPAIGTLPQDRALKIQLGPEPRGYFGGFVESFRHKQPFSVVTIRCFEWRDLKVQVCIGGGVLKESLAEEEWAELEEKWTTFQAIWEIGC